MKLSSLSGRKVCDTVRAKGKAWKGDAMVIRHLAGAPRNPNIDPEENAIYVGTLASRKLHKSAVKRNRMRRRCREALRTAVQNEKKIPTVQLLICPRSISLGCDYSLIKRDVDRFLNFISNK